MRNGNPKIDQWVADAWLGGIGSDELEDKMRQDGYTEATIDAAIDVYDGLDRWNEKSLMKLAASCRDWREF